MIIVSEYNTHLQRVHMEQLNINLSMARVKCLLSPYALLSVLAEDRIKSEATFVCGYIGIGS